MLTVGPESSARQASIMLVQNSFGKRKESVSALIKTNNPEEMSPRPSTITGCMRKPHPHHNRHQLELSDTKQSDLNSPCGGGRLQPSSRGPSLGRELVPVASQESFLGSSNMRCVIPDRRTRQQCQQ